MSTTTNHGPAKSEALAGGLTLFAAVMLTISGFLAIFRGIMAIAKDAIFVATPNYVFKFDVTGWGWIHLVLGIVAALAGIALFKAATWARVTGIVIAALLLISSFLSLPYYPLWSIVLIALYGFVIWALCVVQEKSLL
ncbi:hypothetical protein [Streptomyces sp. NPDC058989]|uniref:DUF7144 family membrane protein n=1 Tax=Streptomyces sp. NPDC058989 TaxID=3346686 RepID=UPI0036B5E988